MAFLITWPLSFCVFVKTSEILLANRFFWLTTFKMFLLTGGSQGLSGMFAGEGGPKVFAGVLGCVSEHTSWVVTVPTGQTILENRASAGFTDELRVSGQTSWWKSQLAWVLSADDGF